MPSNLTGFKYSSELLNQFECHQEQLYLWTKELNEKYHTWLILLMYISRLPPTFTSSPTPLWFVHRREWITQQLDHVLFHLWHFYIYSLKPSPFCFQVNRIENVNFQIKKKYLKMFLKYHLSKYIQISVFLQICVFEPSGATGIRKWENE